MGKRSVEHYRDHELVCEVASGATGGWGYTVSVITHRGDDSKLSKDESDFSFASDLDALQAGAARGRQLIDELVAAEQNSG